MRKSEPPLADLEKEKGGGQVMLSQHSPEN